MWFLCDLWPLSTGMDTSVLCGWEGGGQPAGCKSGVRGKQCRLRDSPCPQGRSREPEGRVVGGLGPQRPPVGEWIFSNRDQGLPWGLQPPEGYSGGGGLGGWDVNSVQF